MSFQHFPQAQSTFDIPLRIGKNVYLGDVVSNQSSNPENPVSAGLYRQTKGEPLVHTYKVDEMKIILEGEVEISDGNGQRVIGRPGDIFYFPKGIPFTFTTSDYVLAFYVIQRGPLPA